MPKRACGIFDTVYLSLVHHFVAGYIVIIITALSLSG